MAHHRGWKVTFLTGGIAMISNAVASGGRSADYCEDKHQITSEILSKFGGLAAEENESVPAG